MKNQKCDQVELSESNKLVYRFKEEHDDTKRYKARMAVKGFQQREGIDFIEIFSPVVKLTTIRSVLSIVTVKDLHLEQLDVKTVFLHCDLEEDIFTHVLSGYKKIYHINYRKKMSFDTQVKRFGIA